MIQFSTNHWKDWLEHYKGGASGFSSKALFDYLRHGSSFRAKGGHRALQVLVLPSFDPVVSYEIYLVSIIDNDGFRNLFYLLKTTWQQDLDLKAFGSGMTAETKVAYMPEFKYQQAEIDNEMTETVFQGFQTAIPAWFHASAEYDFAGNDGTVTELAFGGDFLGARYLWWTNKPEQWTPLYQATNNAISVFEHIFESSLE